MKLAAILALLLLLPAAAARAASAPDAGEAFDPVVLSEPLYGISEPGERPGTREMLTAEADGARLYVETWLPAAQDGREPPARVPTILVMSPYASTLNPGYYAGPTPLYQDLVDFFVPRGYAVAQHHVRGTGESGGCLEQTAAKQIADGAQVVEWLGGKSPWADGNVAMYGVSYDAETQISVAGLGDPAKTRYLKAIVPVATVAGQYEYSFFDGVPYTGQAISSNAFYLGLVSAMPDRDPQNLVDTFEKATCQGEVFAGSADMSGDMTPFWKAREYRPGAPKIRAATLMVHGLADWNVKPISQAGFFDRLPDSTPHKGLFGVWEHATPDSHSVEPDWEREDWLPMVGAWYDRYLKGLDTGADRWPAVQVQATDGQWREEVEWPATGGPVGQLGLGPGGTLGATSPSGSDAYSEGYDPYVTSPSQELAFETPALAEPLHVTGQPVLDLWVTLDRDDAHLAAVMTALDADGSPISTAHGWTMGFRSARHLDPLVDNHFMQEQGRPAPAGQPLRVQVRFHPNDVRVPAGGKLRLQIAGSVRGSAPSGAGTAITVLHDCAHPSALRFLMADPGARLLNVRERDEAGAALASAPAATGTTDGGGAATAPLCGRPPERLETFGPARAPVTTAPAPAAPAAACGRPRAGIRRARVTRRRVQVTGRVRAATCGGRTVRAKRVEVVVARERCRSRACRRRFVVQVRRSRWTLSRRVRLAGGRYRVTVRALAGGGRGPAAVRRVRAR